MKEYLKNNRIKGLAYFIGVLVVLINLYTAVTLVNDNIYSGSAITEAGYYLKDNGAEFVVSNSYPVLYYLSGARITPFPERDFESFMFNEDVHYIVLDYYEPTYPSYVWDYTGGKWPSSIFDRYNLVMKFREFDRTVVWIYGV